MQIHSRDFHDSLSVCLPALVCESYVVHHLVSTGLRCAPPGCVVHHGAQGGPLSVRSGHGWIVHIIFLWLTTNVQIKGHSVQFCTNIHFGSAQRSFVLIRWCTRRFCMFVKNHLQDGVQSSVVSLSVCLSICHMDFTKNCRKSFTSRKGSQILMSKVTLVKVIIIPNKGR